MVKVDYDIGEIAKIICEKILPDPDVEDWRKKNYELMAKTIEDTTCDNIYNVYSPLKLAKMLKEESEKFLKLSEKFHHTAVDYRKEKQEDIIFDEKVSRLFLGISCELILKSAFLLNGYCIHIIKRKKFPITFDKLSDSDIFCDNTQKFGDLLNNLNLIFPECEESQINAIKGFLEIAKDWRNNDIHLGVRHWENLSFRSSIKTCWEIINKTVEILICKEELRNAQEQ